MGNIKINKYITIAIAAVVLYVALYFIYSSMGGWDLSF